ncbi:Precorrin-2 methylase [Pyrobaculum oguniense TE7]|uniref:Precorrin-2 methylase n=1 Tax=Pyrobaculum oguniense (strain DSM 13380 / JCM 10595 / TE7) TaxID=698757 RepID=H6QAB1_PYROT|nr:Precorrin-2 methylase [Pyrobaculum oguniense TE7]
MLKVVGLGPGHPDLLTLAAVKALREADIVFVPRSSRSESSIAKRLVKRYAAGEVVELEFTMGASSAEEVKKNAKAVEAAGGRRVFAVLGDPSLYSTFAKIRPYVKEPVEYIPGVSAILSCALRAGKELATGDDAVAIVPATRPDLLIKAAELFDVVVVVKANRNLDLVNKLMAGRGVAVRRCYMSEEAISGSVQWEDYFTTAYIWR